MLGEKRSRSAFYADSSVGVREEPAACEHGRPDIDVEEMEGIRLGYPDFAGMSEAISSGIGEPPMVPGTVLKEKPKQEVQPEPKTASETVPVRSGVRRDPRKVWETETVYGMESDAMPEKNVSSKSALEQPRTSAKSRNLRPHNLFFSAEEEKREFSSVLREVQAYLSKEYSSLVTGDGSEEVKEQIRRFAGKYIQDHRIAVEGKTTDELIDAIYSEMAEFGFLTKYVYGEGIEEIDVNAWDDVEVQFSGGVTKKLTEHFDSPEHAINVVRRMLHISGMVLDDASPSVLGHFG